MNTKVSVIVPVYNGEKYLKECLDSILKQTLKEIEVICVDDGSKDHSVQILEKYQKNDTRIKILKQENKFAGVARNHGMEHANGEYLVFLDCDDFFEKDMLASLYKKAKETEADIVISGIAFYKGKGEETKQGPLSMNLLKELNGKEVFSYKDVPDYIIDGISDVPWNKFFKTEFVKKNCLQFQETQRNNDIYFSKIASVLAERISFLNKAFVHYRMTENTNLQSKTYLTPLCSYEVVLSVKRELEQKNKYEEVENSFINYAASSLIYSMEHMQRYDGFEILYQYLVDKGWKELGISLEQISSLRSHQLAEKIEDMLTKSIGNYIFHIKKDMEIRYENKMQVVKTSSAYKVGTMLTKYPRKILGKDRVRT